ncbi:hypothetical protein [Streptomyces sp. NL15-2K]|uniref:hypothetical protein n=1 Tax=Streptomyces sp. NL15-2K TaxID=376149 RepID=UPI000F57CCE0|nr:MULTISPECIES: hypothetical protein [Actinomycetes]WKX08912.1 hypothetical protein Q4V64_16000 [Kutzneria buriramensis]GCB49597.1 hypothetical protein SNL152K_6936 [Streptomyces sp. NL15-2K]
MSQTSPSSRTKRLKKTAARFGTVAAASGLLAAVGAGTASADTFTVSGDLSWRATEVKRLANCAGTAWYNDSKVGDAITGCSGSDAKWDSVQLKAASLLTIDGRKVAYRSDQSCPPKRGFQYVKCYYVGGKTKGNPVITVSVISYGLGGMDLAVDWYYI